MRSLVFSLILLGISISSGAAEIKKEIKSSSALTIRTLSVITPLISTRLVQLLDQKYNCSNVKVDSNYVQGFYFHDINVSVYANCPDSIADLGIDFHLSLPRGAFMSSSLGMNVILVSSQGQETIEKISLLPTHK